MTPLPIAIPMILLCLGSGGFAAYWCVVAYRITRMFRGLPTARAGLGMPCPKASVCVIVPAHNEAGNIASLIESLKSQTHQDFRVVLALDRCTDDTLAVATEAIESDSRFEIVVVTECPEGWAGKVHAAHTGHQQSEFARAAGFLLFTDADCEFAPEALAATTALLAHRGLDMLSLYSTLSTGSWFERIVQPAAGFVLGAWYPLNRANAASGVSQRPFANGQFMLFGAQAYQEFGGHANPNVRSALLEDIAFARGLAKSEKSTGLLLADGVVRCRMYDTWAEFRKGWKRIYTESANRKPGRLASAAWEFRVLSVLPLVAMVCLGLSWLVPWGDQPLAALAVVFPVIGLLAWLYSVMRVQRSTHAPIRMGLLWPVGQWLVAGILAEAARDLRKGVPTEWGGQRYNRDAR